MTDAAIEGYVKGLFPDEYVGHAIEIGACDGVYLSNTLKLEKSGWKVLCIEPNPIYFEDLKDNRKICLPYACSSENEDGVTLAMHDREGIPQYGWAPDEPVSFLEKHRSQQHIDVFCPDILPPSHHLVDVRTLDFCLEEVRFPKADFLSLDVDGIELKVLQGLDTDRWKTRVIVVENPFNNEEIDKHLLAKGFAFKERIYINDIWVKE